MDGAVKYSLEKPKHIILLYFRALFLDLLRFPYLAEGHQEPELHPLPFNQMRTGFFGSLFVPHMQENYVRGLHVCMSTQFPSDPRSDLPLLTGCFLLRVTGSEWQKQLLPPCPSRSLSSHAASPSRRCVMSSPSHVYWLNVGDKQETVPEL